MISAVTLPPVQRQLENALVFDDLTDADLPGLDERRAGLDLHGLGKFAKLEDDVDGGDCC